MMAAQYAVRSDGTVVGPSLIISETTPGAPTPAMTTTSARVAYRFWPGQTSGMQRSKPLASDDAVAVWDPSDKTVVYDSTASSMLRGTAPKMTHGFLGFLGGIVAGASLLGGPLGWIGGPIVGTIIGEHISTKQGGVQMTPVIAVK